MQNQLSSLPLVAFCRMQAYHGSLQYFLRLTPLALIKKKTEKGQNGEHLLKGGRSTGVGGRGRELYVYYNVIVLWGEGELCFMRRKYLTCSQQ